MTSFTDELDAESIWHQQRWYTTAWQAVRTISFYCLIKLLCVILNQCILTFLYLFSSALMSNVAFPYTFCLQFVFQIQFNEMKLLVKYRTDITFAQYIAVHTNQVWNAIGRWHRGTPTSNFWLKVFSTSNLLKKHGNGKGER